MRNHGIMARLMTMIVVLALALAPAIIVVTHGPSATAAADQIIAHGHSHDAGVKTRQGHDATDHEHQNSAVLTARHEGHDAPRPGTRVMVAIAGDGHAEDLPRRPPRV